MSEKQQTAHRRCKRLEGMLYKVLTSGLLDKRSPLYVTIKDALRIKKEDLSDF